MEKIEHNYQSLEGAGKAVKELSGIPNKIENDCWFKKVNK